jgi:hypothetical protein
VLRLSDCREIMLPQLDSVPTFVIAVGTLSH